MLYLQFTEKRIYGQFYVPMNGSISKELNSITLNHKTVLFIGGEYDTPRPGFLENRKFIIFLSHRFAQIIAHYSPWNIVSATF